MSDETIPTAQTDDDPLEEATTEDAHKATEDPVVDKHGQPGINRERHDKEVAALNEKIAELEGKVAEAAKTEESRDALQKEIDSLKAEQADSKITHKLEMAGCLNTKAAKALLEDYDGDVSKLKEDCPYLFSENKPKGSTGAKPVSATSQKEERIKAAREAAGLPIKE